MTDRFESAKLHCDTGGSVEVALDMTSDEIIDAVARASKRDQQVLAINDALTGLLNERFPDAPIGVLDDHESGVHEGLCLAQAAIRSILIGEASEGFRSPFIVTTVDELDALPNGAVILPNNGKGKAVLKEDDWWYAPDPTYTWMTSPNGIRLPALVIHKPEES